MKKHLLVLSSALFLAWTCSSDTAQKKVQKEKTIMAKIEPEKEPAASNEKMEPGQPEPDEPATAKEQAAASSKTALENRDPETRMNRLSFSQSPYLLQHKNNPVDWYPWGNEAFQKAKAENKPIFLSIGYSTCHWCHVMEHESFEDDDVASLMNASFVSIKVDREEMPEVDHLYMSVCQAMTGRGGWPLTIIMTPDKEPFFAGTYFPKNSRGQRPGMMELIPGMANAWKSKQGDIQNTIQRVRKYLTSVNNSKLGPFWNQTILSEAYGQYVNRFDDQYGGFGRAPKFPSPHNLIYLLRYHHIFKDPAALSMVETTLQWMRLGGIFDHIGLGFHRYSTDNRWFLPHFEKMLYDQAMLSMAYLEAYQVTGKTEYADIAREIFTYVLRDMTDPKGGFYSAEDADSEGEEGKFYVWNNDEIIELLGPENGAKFFKIFGFSPSGNFKDEATGQASKNNIPYLPRSLQDLAKNMNMSLNQLTSFIDQQRQILFNHREKRIHPLKDDKILTDWNGLMIAALALGASVLNDGTYKKAAEKAAHFLLKNLKDKNGKLMKRYRQGVAGIPPHLDDYAFMVWGLLNLYEATFDPYYLNSAVELGETMVTDFADEKGGAFFIGPDYAEKLMVRAKDSYDGAIPSGNSVAAMDCIRLARFTGNSRWTELADNIFRSFSDITKRAPTGHAYMLSAFLFDQKNPKEIVLAGKKGEPETAAILRTIQEHYTPHRVILFKDMSNPKILEKAAPWIQSHLMKENKPTIYVCENFACQQPTTDILTALGYMDK